MIPASHTPSVPVADHRRRRLLHAAAATLATLPWLARADTFPSRPIRLIVPSAAGGAPDAICRALGQELSKQLNQSVVIDNKPGASGSIGIVEVARSAPDGYTLGYANVVTLAINQSLLPKLPYDADRDLAPVALLGFVQNALVVRNDLPVKNVRELVALAARNPGKLSMGSAGNGTTGHLGGELFKSMTNVFITHIPYRGSPQAIQDLLGGRIDLMFDNLSSIGPQIKAGQVRALAVSGTARSPQFPELPTMAEAGVPGYATVAWGGIVAPAATPQAIVLRLNAEINKALNSTPVREALARLSFEPAPGPPAALFDLARRERPLWADVIKRSGAKID
ncbi:MAG: Bug family tripartite tricarboxylate transporter substrate binding protein [Betaproteobacteria bacterium]